MGLQSEKIGVVLKVDDDLGSCTVNFGTIDDNTFDKWFDLENVAHGKLHIHAERFSLVTSDRVNVKTVKPKHNQYSNDTDLD